MGYAFLLQTHGIPNAVWNYTEKMVYEKGEIL